MMIRQFKAAAARVEATPVRSVGFIETTLDPNRDFEQARDDSGRKGRHVLKRETIEKLPSKTTEFFKTHHKTLITVGTTAEADAVAAALNKAFGSPTVVFAAWHSKMKNAAQIWADFNSGKIQHLVAVTKFDEGLNVKSLDGWLDL